MEQYLVPKDVDWKNESAVRAFAEKHARAGGGFYGFALFDGVEDVGEDQVAGLD